MPFFNFFIQTAILLITKTWWIWCWVESKAEIYFAGFVSAIYFLRSLINGIDLVQVSILKFFATRGSLHCLLFNDVFTYELISSRSHWEIWDQENINILNDIFLLFPFLSLIDAPFLQWNTITNFVRTPTFSLWRPRIIIVICVYIPPCQLLQIDDAMSRIIADKGLLR